MSLALLVLSACGLSRAELARNPAREAIDAQPVTAPSPLGSVDWSCPMHPEVHADQPGACPICGMALVEPGAVTVPIVTFEPGGRRIEVPEGTSVLDAAHLAGATSVECCGIEPACGECRMSVLEGEDTLSPPDALEAGVRAGGRFLPYERLACMAHVLGDVTTQLER